MRRALEDSIFHGPKRERPNGPVRWPSESAEEIHEQPRISACEYDVVASCLVTFVKREATS